MKTDVDEEQIAPYMKEINRQFEYMDKEDVIKKMVSATFGRFLDYYKNAPVIEKPASSRKSDKKQERGGKDSRGSRRGSHKAEKGYQRLFINLGKDDGFYPGEIMQFVNRYVKGRQEVGHIDLLKRQSYIEVPEGDARKVMKALDGAVYKGRKVRCNDADSRLDSRGAGRKRKQAQADNGAQPSQQRFKKDDWRALMNAGNPTLKGEEPDFSEEGWARRKPKK